MRTIKDDFTAVEGAPVIFTQYLRGVSWRRQGMPRAKPVDRMVWHFLRSCDCHKRLSIGEVAREVWGVETDHRNTARSSLKRLKKIGLAFMDDGGWMAIMPGPRSAWITKHMGVIIVPGKPSDGGDNHHGSGGDNHHPCTIIDQGQSSRGGGDKRHGKGVTIVTSKGDKRHPIEKRREREEETTTNPRELPTIEELIYKVLKIGVADAIDIHPKLFENPEEAPTDEISYRRWIAVAVASVIEKTKKKNREEGQPTSISGLIVTIQPSFEDQHCRATNAISQFLEQQEFEKKKQQRQETQQAVIKKSNPKIPAWDAVEDKPEITPKVWLENRMPELHKRVMTIIGAEGDEAEFFRSRIFLAEGSFEDRWDRSGKKNKMLAQPMRLDYTVKLASICNEFEEDKNASC